MSVFIDGSEESTYMQTLCVFNVHMCVCACAYLCMYLGAFVDLCSVCVCVCPLLTWLKQVGI